MQKSIHIIENYEQLRVISDPLRIKILMYLVEKPHTVHQLAQKLNLSRAKVLYHIRELEKHNLIYLVKKEEKGGNILKYYQSLARGYIPSDHLLNFTETKEATRQSYLEVLDRAKTRILTAPNESFSPNSANVEEWESISLQTELKISCEDFKEFTSKYRQLLEEYSAKETIEKEEHIKNFYVMITGFLIDEPLFKNQLD